MAYKDQAKRRAKEKEYRETHKEERAAVAKRWREKNKEKYREYMRRYRDTHREKVRQLYRDWYDRNKRKARTAEDGTMELEKCPKCNSDGVVRPVSTGFAPGCSSRTCGLWVEKQKGRTFGTEDAAALAWNAFVQEAREGVEEEKAEEERIESAIPAEWDAGGPKAQEEEEEAERKAAEEEAADDDEEPEETPEEDTELYARFWLEMDGVWYWLDRDGGEGCDGCAFRLAFGRRTICGAETSEDCAMAAKLCKELGGQWKEGET